MPVPAMPGPCLIVIEAEFVLGGLEAFLDAPAGFFDPDQYLDRGALGTPCREIGHIIIRGVAPDQQATRPQACSVFIVFRGVEVSQFTISPVVKTLALGALSCVKALPSRFRQTCGYVFGLTCDKRLCAPRSELVIGIHAQDITLAGTAQHRLDITHAIHTIGCDPRKRNMAASARSIISTASADLVAKPTVSGT